MKDNNCTILLTTHSMEEADALGDRIGIMAEGKLHCCGSPMFLKKYFKTGYTLKVSVKENATPDAILQVVQNHIPNAVIKIDHPKVSSEVAITLPTDTTTSSAISALLSDMTMEKDQLGIITFGFSLATMDDVFHRVGELTKDYKLDVNEEEEQVSLAIVNHERDNYVGLKLGMQRFQVLLFKKMIYIYHRRKLFIGFPAIFALYLLFLVITLFLPFRKISFSDPLNMTLDSYNNPVTLVLSTDSSISSTVFSNTIGSSFRQVPANISLEKALLNAKNSSLVDYREKYIVALEANSTNFHAMFNTIPTHAGPLAINLASNVILRNMNPRRNLTIHVKIQKLEEQGSLIQDDTTDDFILPAMVQLISALVASFIIFPTEENVLKSKQLQMMTGVSPLTYWYSSFLWDFLLVFLTVCLLTTIFYHFLQSVWSIFLILLTFGFAAIPFSYVISLYSSTSSEGVSILFMIEIFSRVLGAITSDPEKPVSWFDVIIRWMNHLIPTFGARESAIHGIEKDYFIMLIMAFVYHAILMLHEYKVFECRSCFWKQNAAIDVIEEDVRTEENRIVHLIITGNVDDDALVVENLSKNHGGFEAVPNLNFGVHHGECFGFLGVNGAGKTTAFRMLTGDLTRFFGNAYAFSKTLQNNKEEFLSNIGYCPQFDGVIGVLSGRQMLQLYARLRGIPSNAVDVEVNKWLRKMDLHEVADVQCDEYSGGMKRKLSVAMAMIGDPPLLILDEPTSGVDPISRRRLWIVLRSLQNSGQSIVLTSHSMDECETLCSRLSIMVNGKLQCLGNVQHLKNKFAKGYTLSIKLKSTCYLPEGSMDAQVAHLKYDVVARFHPCKFIELDLYMGVYTFRLQGESLTWEFAFKKMDNLKMEYNAVIEYYLLKETTFEEVFLNIARKQYERVEAGLKCKCC